MLCRTALDALVMAGDLGLGCNAQDWGHNQFLEDLDHCSVAANLWVPLMASMAGMLRACRPGSAPRLP